MTEKVKKRLFTKQSERRLREQGIVEDRDEQAQQQVNEEAAVEEEMRQAEGEERPATEGQTTSEEKPREESPEEQWPEDPEVRIQHLRGEPDDRQLEPDPCPEVPEAVKRERGVRRHIGA